MELDLNLSAFQIHTGLDILPQLTVYVSVVFWQTAQSRSGDPSYEEQLIPRQGLQVKPEKLNLSEGGKGKRLW